MKYLVTIGYEEFEFKRGMQALNFAETARITWRVNRDYRDKVTIRVDLEEKEMDNNEREDEE